MRRQRAKLLPSKIQNLLDKVLREIREQDDRSRTKNGSKRGDLKVSKTMSNNPDMLTEKELHSVTTVFKSLETNSEDGTILPEVELDYQDTSN